MGEFRQQTPILKAREASLQDLRWRRAVGGSSAMPVRSPAKAGVRTVAPGFSRNDVNLSVAHRSRPERWRLAGVPAAEWEACAGVVLPANVEGLAVRRRDAAGPAGEDASVPSRNYGSYGGFAAEGHSVNGRRVNG
jgi:hypothetical protein